MIEQIIPITNKQTRQAAMAQFQSDGSWRIWLNYNTKLSAGTYIELMPNGSMIRVTVNPDGSMRSITGVVTK